MLRLTLERKNLGLSKAEVSRKTGLHPTVIGGLESGTMYPWPKYKKLLGEFFGLDGEVLFEGVSADAQPNNSRAC